MTSAHDHEPPPPEAEAALRLGLDPRRLLVFQQVGRTGSFAAAARSLGWTQPAVSQHVHRLEEELGLPLFTRIGRGIALTEPGRSLLAHAEAVANALRVADRRMSQLAGLRGGQVRVAAFPSASATLVARAMGTLAGAHPDLEVRLTQLEPPEAEALLRAGDTDIALVFDYEEDAAADRSGFESTSLRADTMQVVLPQGHRLSSAPAVPLAALREDRWIAGCPRCRRHLDAITAGAGFAPDVRHSTDDAVVVQSLVAAGLAVAILPALAIDASRHPDVAVRPLAEHAPRRISALTAAGARRDPAIAATLHHLALAFPETS